MSGFSNSKQHHLPSRAMRAGLGTLLLFPCVGNAVTDFEPTIYSQYHYDSNVYRLSDIETSQVDQLEDSALVQGASVDLSSSYRGYSLTANADVRELNYSHHNLLDNQQSEYKLRFKGSYGLYWDYEIGIERDSQLTEFNGDTVYFDTLNIARTNKRDISIKYQLAAFWQSILDIKWQSQDYTHLAYRPLNRNETAVTASLMYNRSLGWIKPFIRLQNEHYPNRALEPTSTLSTRSKSMAFGAEAEKAIEGHSYLYSSLALTKSRNTGNISSDRVNPIFTISYRWIASAKSSLIAEYSHMRHSATRTQVDYVDNDRVKIEAQWRPQFNLTMAAGLSRTLSEYTDSELGEVNEHLNRAHLRASYQLLKRCQASFEMRQIVNNSSNHAYAFDSNSANVTFSIQI